MWTSPTFGLAYLVFFIFNDKIKVVVKEPEFDLFFLLISSLDKDKDGSFRWVDKTEIQFSNYGPNWPQNTPNLWDCGQIFTGSTLI